MKLNFWQWLAVGLLIIGCGIWIYESTHKKQNPNEPQQMPANQSMHAAPTQPAAQ